MLVENTPKRFVVRVSGVAGHAAGAARTSGRIFAGIRRMHFRVLLITIELELGIVLLGKLGFDDDKFFIRPIAATVR